MARLPASWVWTKLKEISGTASGGTPSRRKREYFGGDIPWLKSGELDNKIVNSAEESITQEGLANSSAKIIPRGTLLMALYGATVGKLGILGIDAAINQALCAISPYEGIFSDFLFWYLISHREELLGIRKGGAQPNISQEIVRGLPIPLAPFNEQFRIVGRIEELVAWLDGGVEGLRKVKAQLKRYRQAVLKYAFEGKLTEEWRKTHKDQMQPAQKILERIRTVQKKTVKEHYGMSTPKTRMIQELPTTWSWAQLGELVSESLLGLVIPISRQIKKADGTPYIKMNNITSDGNLDLTNIVYVKVYPADIHKYQLEKGDILFNTRNSYELVGKTSVVMSTEMPMVFNNNIMRIRLAEGINPFFVTYQMNSPAFRALMMREKKATTNICALYAKDLFPLPIAVAPVEEQRKTVEEIQRCISVVDYTEKVITLGFQQTERLRQSILKAAFEGELVPQDPSDEPAERLLERIKAERTKSKGEKDTNSKNKSQLELPTYVK